MKSLIVLTLFTLTILSTNVSFAHKGCGLNPICGDDQFEGEPVRYLPPTQDTQPVPNQSNEFDTCSNEDYQISIRSSDAGWLTALLTNRSGNLLAQFDVHFDQTIQDYVGHGFSLKSLNSPAYPVPRDVYVSAELVAADGNVTGRMVCESKKKVVPAGRRQCLGMQMASYFGGAWHCVSVVH